MSRTSADSPPPVLFICTGNFYRSRHAEAVFNWHASQRGLPIRAFSRGLLTSMVADEPTRLSPNTSKRLAALGIAEHLTGAIPIQLTVADLEKAGRAVALRRHEHRAMMLQAHPEWVDRIEYWNVQDIDEIEPTEALPAIEQQVTALISLYA